MPVISPFYVAVACGVAGAYVDVTSYVSFAPGDGIAGSWGKQDQFRDANPGTWSLYFNNLDGRFTPDTTNGILATPLTEGMGVNWQFGTRYIAGSIIGFALMNDGTGRLRVDVDDSLGDLARTQVSVLSRAMVLGASPYLYWPFNDAAGQSIGTEQSGNNQAAFNPANEPFFSPAPTYGVAGVPNIGETQLFLPGLAYYATPGENGGSHTTGTFGTINYPSGSMGAWGAWITTAQGFTSSGGTVYVLIGLNGPSIFLGGSAIYFGVNASGRYFARTPQGNVLTGSATATPGVPQYVQIIVTYASSTTLSVQLFVGGVSQGTVNDAAGYTNNFDRSPSYVALNAAGTSTGGFTISHLAHNPAPVPEYLLAYGTEGGIISAAVATTAGVALAALPTDMSAAPASPQTSSGSALSNINDAIRSEQGYLSCTTTGSLTSPTQTVTVRARQRPTTVTASFSALNDLANRAEFTREITNLVTSATAAGPSTSTTWLDPSVTARAASANVSEKVVLTQSVDQLGYAQDRINRGKNSVLRAPAFVIDALHTTTDRSADLLAIQFGDRVQITDLDPTVTGSSTYDCWIIGRAEAQDIGQQKFTFYVQPVLPATGIYDTDLYANGGNNTISTTLTNVATSMVIASADGITWFEQVQVPYTLLLEAERVTVTAAAAPSAGTQTLTITRAQGGTSAAAHAVGVVPEVVTNSIYAF